MKKIVTIILITMFVLTQTWAENEMRWPNYVATTGTAGVVSGEDYPKLFDNDTSTKWCVTGFSGVYIEFDATSLIRPTGYVLTTASDTQQNTGRNPKNWIIKGRRNTNEEWTTLDEISNGGMPTGNCSSKTFTLSTNSAYRYYRFEVTALVSGSIFQLSEFYFLVNDTAQNDVEDVVELVLGSNGSSPLFTDCPLDSVFIGRNITYPTGSDKGYSPFYRNTSLRSVHITNQETEIMDNEFYGCTNLKNVRIGDGVTSIGNWAFSGCASLDYFEFGKNVESIEQEAFSDCTSVTNLISWASTPPTCGTQALDDINKWVCTLKVPKGVLPAYMAADQWKDFFFIEEMPIGDLNGDGELTMTDVNILVNIILGHVTTYDMSIADVNRDGNISVADVTALVNMIRSI